MKITPLIRVRHMATSIAFYTNVLDFVLVGSGSDTTDPAFCILTREDAELNLSSHTGDGVFGNVVSVMVSEVDDLFRSFIHRGLDISKKSESPVHQGPVDQTWGTREFYVSDPDGNTLRYYVGKGSGVVAASRGAQCLSFLRVPDVSVTVDWYKSIGFTCLGTHEEPGCGVDWALMDWKGAQFMLYPEGHTTRDSRDAGLYFAVDSIDSIAAVIKAKADVIEENPGTEYGKKEIVFRDINGFQVTFGCDI
jgi:catechol 2,3-dioxygenase-like lactoylglutathione lyase family enzyme